LAVSRSREIRQHRTPRAGWNGTPQQQTFEQCTAMFTTLITAQQLAARATQPDWLVIDCRFDLAKPEAGAAAYASGHIPGAIYAHLDRDLSGPITPTSGRHPLPSAAAFAATLGSWGVTAATQVIAYDADTGVYGARLWWLLRWVGHHRVAVLDGGLKAWQQQHLPLSDQPAAARVPSEFRAQPDDTLWLDSQSVATRAAAADWRLLDVRGAERFAGIVEPIDRVAGHVPGARNLPFTTNLDANSQFLPAPQLRAQITAHQDGAADAHTIAMCGSGVTACHLLLAMEIAGLRGGRLYAGSWSEWIRDPQRRVATGSQGT
jgi:thiosulfate/3-mercaptopyruvate sulfurtransferase